MFFWIGYGVIALVAVVAPSRLDKRAVKQASTACHCSCAFIYAEPLDLPESRAGEQWGSPLPDKAMLCLVTPLADVQGYFRARSDEAFRNWSRRTLSHPP